jgi:hypothetical protein
LKLEKKEKFNEQNMPTIQKRKNSINKLKTKPIWNLHATNSVTLWKHNKTSTQQKGE